MSVPQSSRYIGLGDDSLCVRALGGAPGIYSARFAGEHGNDAANNLLLLEKLKGVSDRSAEFVCAVSCVFPDGRKITVRGNAEGEILKGAEGSGGFGYDPLFYSPKAGKTFAELTAEEKNRISHRAAALRLFAAELKKAVSAEKAIRLLGTAETGCLATVGADGAPYVTPVHFVYLNGKIYIHGSLKGRKAANILRDGKVGFSAYLLQGYVPDHAGRPCNTNTAYESVIVTGNAVIADDKELKKTVLREFARKYTPLIANADIPDARVAGTGIIEINITEISGKYHN